MTKHISVVVILLAYIYEVFSSNLSREANYPHLCFPQSLQANLVVHFN
jgi:hypothetical protein